MSVAVTKLVDRYCLFASFVDPGSIFRSHTVTLAAQCKASVFDSLSRIRHCEVIFLRSAKNYDYKVKIFKKRSTAEHLRSRIDEDRICHVQVKVMKARRRTCD